MHELNRTLSTRRICAAVAAAGLAAGAAFAAAPASAQATVEELTVFGRYGPAGDIQSLSRVVSYRDLDLTTQHGQDILRQRIVDTARDLCTELGEPSRTQAGSIVPSCRQEAEQNAMAQMRIAVAQATPRGPGWAPPPMAAAPPPAAAPAAGEFAAPVAAEVRTRLITNGPVPDTPENRARFGGPDSRAGQRTAPAGN